MKEDLLKIIQSRRSVRRYSQSQILDNDLQEILKTGFSAPSAGNRQPWRIVIVRDRGKMEQIASAAYGQTFLAGASVVLVVVAVPYESAERYGERGAELYALQDTAALTQNILLAALALEYATCWIGAFNEDEVAKILNVPEGMRPVSIIPIGRLEGALPKARPRKPIAEVVIEEAF
ncbi:nitroreductase family protein [Candidatus Thorarchaeota archaeon]|nr:MAG: nitroreductase family protein [Candidatus Thorarchaeota archaeon]